MHHGMIGELDESIEILILYEIKIYTWVDDYFCHIVLYIYWKFILKTPALAWEIFKFYCSNFALVPNRYKSQNTQALASISRIYTRGASSRATSFAAYQIASMPLASAITSALCIWNLCETIITFSRSNALRVRTTLSKVRKPAKSSSIHSSGTL